MPVNKVDGEMLRKNRVAYEVVPRDVVQQVKNPDALAIWIYLLTKPDNWVVRRTDIRRHFGLGMDRYSNAMRELREMGLVVSAAISDGKTGQLQGKVIWVNACVTEVPENPNVGKNRTSGFPECRENRTLKETEIQLQKQRTYRAPAIADAKHDVMFASFWMNYPKKVDKKKAHDVFRRLPEDKQVAAVEDAASGRYNGTEKRFIPNPTTYLRGERWDDERLPMASERRSGFMGREV